MKGLCQEWSFRLGGQMENLLLLVNVVTNFFEGIAKTTYVEC